MKIKNLLIFIIFFLTTTIYSQTFILEGEWYNEEKDAVITIKKDKSDKYFGIITWMKYPNDDNGNPKKDPLNPEEKLRKRNRLGMKIMDGFSYDNDNKWDQGKIYDPKSGNTYKGTITLNTRNTLDLRGYVGISWFGRTSFWTRKEK